jgi:hypothetical protein
VDELDNSWRPVPGQVALIEYAEDPPGDTVACLTGLVLSDNNGHVTVDLGASGPLADGVAEIVVSFFSPEALYRVRATARTADPPAVIELDRVIDVERVQRRVFPRIPMRAPVVLSSFDEPSVGFPSVKGYTIDLGPGGLRVETSLPFPSGADPTVDIHLADGRQIVARTRIVMADQEDNHCEYRLAFVDLSDEDAAIVTELVDAELHADRPVI